MAGDLLLAFQLILDLIKIGILNLVFSEVEIMPVLTIKADGISTFAVAERVVRYALTVENGGEGLRLGHQTFELLIRLFLMPDGSYRFLSGGHPGGHKVRY